MRFPGASTNQYSVTYDDILHIMIKDCKKVVLTDVAVRCKQISSPNRELITGWGDVLRKGPVVIQLANAK